jgi:quinol monooxygenase YgiN
VLGRSLWERGSRIPRQRADEHARGDNRDADARVVDRHADAVPVIQKGEAMVVVAKIRVKQGREAEAEAAFRKQIDFVIREEPGTLLYIMHRGRKDATTFLFYEKYVDAAAFDRHGKSPAIQELFKTLSPLLEGPPSIELYDEIVGKS